MPSERRRCPGLTTLAGDERWPSWTADGRVVFSHRAGGRWRLHVVDAAGGTPKPLFSDTAGRRRAAGPRLAGRQARRVLLGSRQRRWRSRSVGGGADARPARSGDAVAGSARVRGVEGFPAWSPDSSRLAFFAVREGAGGVWVVGVPDVLAPPAAASASGRRWSSARARRLIAPRDARLAPRRSARVVSRRQAPRDCQPSAARSQLQRQSRTQHRRAAAALCRWRRVPPVAGRRAAADRLRRARDR